MDIKSAARAIYEKTGTNVLIKGGHYNGYSIFFAFPVYYIPDNFKF